MNNEQFSELMEGLERIRCEITDIELVVENNPERGKGDSFTALRKRFFNKLEEKTGWGRNEIKSAFDEALSESI